jgi:[ribosomal protein S5]-alanine N-acetyltransferase
MSTDLGRPSQPRLPQPAPRDDPRGAWIGGVPTMGTQATTLRALLPTDAETLFSLLTTEPVGQFILPPPHSVEDFGRFIDWTHRQQEAGRHLCFGIVPPGQDTAVGVIQVRREASDCSTAEWGFVLSERFWGTGLFMASAELVLQFLFDTVGIHRLEARTIVGNARASGALKKLGAVQEGLLRGGFGRNGEYFDQILWSILAEDRHPATSTSTATTLH